VVVVEESVMMEELDAVVLLDVVVLDVVVLDVVVLDVVVLDVVVEDTVDDVLLEVPISGDVAL
jgi:hypothetical protein